MVVVHIHVDSEEAKKQKDQLDVSLKSWDWYSGGREFDPRSVPISFLEICSGNNFCGHSLLTTDLSRAVISYWRKDVH